MSEPVSAPTDDVLGCAPGSLSESGMSARVPQSQDSAADTRVPLYVDAEGRGLPLSQLPRGVREAFKKLLYAKAPLFVKMKAILRREVETEMKAGQP